MDIKAPDLGVDSAEVSEIMVEVGDVIAKDDNIILLESDKASVEVPSSAAGKVTKISVAVGDQVSEGMVLIELDSDSDFDSQNDSQSTDTENKTCLAGIVKFCRIILKLFLRKRCRRFWQEDLRIPE